MKDPATMLAELGKPFPQNAIKQRRGGGGKSLSYVETHTVIHRLNSATNGWDFHVKDVQWRNDILMVLGELTIHGLGTRSGFGVQQVVERAGEDLVKGAASDALKKCATLFGVALELYGADYENAPVQRPQSPPNAPKQVNAGTDTPAQPPDRDRAMKALHAAGSTLGFTHDELRMIADNEERIASEGKRSIASLTDAPTALLVHVKSVIESNPIAVRGWLADQKARQAELNPDVTQVPNQRPASSFTN